MDADPIITSNEGRRAAVNRRQWKKACKKAAAEIARRWPGQYTFEPAKGDETVYSPPRYKPERCEGRSGRRYTNAPKGAPVCWEKTSYEYNEWEPRPADSLLRELVWVESVDWEAEAAKLGSTLGE